MSNDDMPFDGTDTFPRLQYAFFTPEGGQFVFRGDSVASIQSQLEELLEAIDETDGPGLLSTLQTIKAAGLIKEPTKAGSGGNSSGNQARGNNDLPPWVLSEANRVLGRDPEPNELKSGEKNGRKWYGVKPGGNGDMTFLNEPKGRR